ncbi:uncharacterized protein PRCAT00003249001 [Priceomyces carsonii]|uniref:uncharacterized protein n=1 Tax=Priceomyces carsonii TaxID=28549 RepID=UPI002ED86F93|nr:unnamed protein product [Priceomyces carsonii]
MTKPEAKDLSHHLSLEAKSRKASPLKTAFKYFGQPGMTFLGGGLPLSDYFPFNKVTADIPTPSFPNGIGAKITDSDKTVIEVFKNKALNKPNEIELSRSLQYGYTEGQPELLKFVKEHTEEVHKIPYSDWDILLSVGNTEAWDATLRTFTTRGDTILVEEYSFSSALETASALGAHTFPIAMDDDGIIPEKLAEVLANWVGPMPKLLYTIPTGQNPTGCSISAKRRKAIYDLAVKYDFLIIEDEPYYFLQMETYTTDKSARESKQIHSHDKFIEALVDSYLSLDTEGRVIRLDSFSKVLAPGLRVGWIVGQAQLIERYLKLHEVSIQCPAGLAQSLVNSLLQSWGHKGYLDWLIGLRAEYTHKRDVAIDAVIEHCPKDVVTFVPPVAGMFFTVSIDASKHPKFKSDFNEDPLKVENSLFEKSVEHGTLMIPGSWFKVEASSSEPQDHVPENPEKKNEIFFRGTYAAVPLDELAIGIKKFGEAIRAEFGL